jgi:hypothetical protein
LVYTNVAERWNYKVTTYTCQNDLQCPQIIQRNYLKLIEKGNGNNLAPQAVQAIILGHLAQPHIMFRKLSANKTDTALQMIITRTKAESYNDGFCMFREAVVT